MNIFSQKRGRRRSVVEENRKNRKRILSVFIIFLIFIAIIITARLNIFFVHNIIITEVAEKKKQIIKNIVEKQLAGSYYYLFPRKNVVFVPRKDIKTALMKQDLSIKSVNIDLRSVNELSIKIVERNPDGLWCSHNDECFFVDEGYVYGKFLGDNISDYNILKTETDPKKIIGTIIIDSEDFRKINTFILYLKRENVSISNVLIQDNGDYEIQTKAGAKIIFNNREDISDTINNLASIVHSGAITKDKWQDIYKTLLYIDLRFGRKIFYKFK